jgi:hypothetical protein
MLNSVVFEEWICNDLTYDKSMKYDLDGFREGFVLLV